ncbi:MAG: hypothetical protein H6907_07755 [Hyphomicrobiales bacterium]|nr:hypothetical protein [Hyphomicrobiales bacterium]MCP5371613.1 hypothetical protein [Hyphomicrobiales bacterium]
MAIDHTAGLLAFLSDSAAEARRQAAQADPAEARALAQEAEEYELLWARVGRHAAAVEADLAA